MLLDTRTQKTLDLVKKIHGDFDRQGRDQQINAYLPSVIESIFVVIEKIIEFGPDGVVVTLNTDKPTKKRWSW